MKILLINTPHYYTGGNREPGDFPLGLGYIAAVLRNEGADVEIFDIHAHQLQKEQVVERLTSYDGFDLIGISAMSTQYTHAKWLASEIRKNHKGPIAVGGALAMFNPKIVLENTEVDICVTGEGEVIMPDLVKNLNKLEEVKGIYYKEKGRIRSNPPAEYIQNLDSIPFPAWDLLPMDIYLKSPRLYEGYGAKNMNIISARGCPFNCRYCSKTFKGVRLRSVDNIIKEIKELQKRYGVSVIQFTEELVIINKKRAHELCKKIKPLGIKWMCQGRVNNVDLPLLKAMKEAGCERIGYGIESGSQKILDNMNKQQTVEMALEAIRNTRKARIRPVIQMMFGYPGETEDTIEETIEFCKRAHVHPPWGFSPTTPIPGTSLYEDAKRSGLIKDEVKYLESFEGYQEILVNMTGFSDEKLAELKNYAEDKCFKNYVWYRRTHPNIFIREYVHKLGRFCKYVKLHGLKKAINDVIRLLKNRPKEMLFNAEYV